MTSDLSGLECRAALGAWRWLLMGTLGIGASTCGGDASPGASEGQGGAAGAPPTAPSACGAETMMEGGLRRCANGLIHRVSVAGCGSLSSPPGSVPDGCSTDSDCEVNELCFCDSSSNAGRCVAAECHAAVECATGSLCGINTTCESTRFVCQTGFDECAVDGDCRSGEQCQLTDLANINPLAGPIYGSYRVCRRPSFCSDS